MIDGGLVTGNYMESRVGIATTTLKIISSPLAPRIQTFYHLAPAYVKADLPTTYLHPV